MPRKKKSEISLGKDFEAEKRMLENGDEDKTTSKASTPAKRIPLELADYWGFEKKNKFPAADEDSYRTYLKGLNKLDVQNECFKNGLAPRDSRETMTAALVKEFRKHLIQLQCVRVEPKNFGTNEQITKIMENSGTTYFK